MKAGQPVVVGIRPEHIAVDLAQATPGLRVSFELIERIPSDRVQLLYATLSGKRIVVKAPLDQSIPRDTPVTIRIDAEHVHAFDVVTGKRI